MSNHNASHSVKGLPAYKATDSSPIAVNNDGTVTLPNASATYYVPIGQHDAEVPSITGLLSIHLRWVTALAGTATVEVCNFPQYVSPAGGGATDVTDTDATAGNWIQLNATTDGHVAVAGSGNSATAMTITIGGTAAGGAYITMPDMAGRRVRVKLVITAAANANDLRVLARGKIGS